MFRISAFSCVCLRDHFCLSELRVSLLLQVYSHQLAGYVTVHLQVNEISHLHTSPLVAADRLRSESEDESTFINKLFVLQVCIPPGAPGSAHISVPQRTPAPAAVCWLMQVQLP